MEDRVDVTTSKYKAGSHSLLFTGAVADNNVSGYFYVPSELNLAAVASRSSLVGALLRTAIPVNRHPVLDFLQGLSRDELECLAEFQGACVLEEEYTVACQPYRLMADFFDPTLSDRWSNPDIRAHRTFVVLAWLDLLRRKMTLHIRSSDLKTTV